MSADFASYLAMGLPQCQPGDYAFVPGWFAPAVLGLILLVVAYSVLLTRARKHDPTASEHPPVPATTTTCGYCGRENEREATHCQECGTALDLPVLTVPATQA